MTRIARVEPVSVNWTKPSLSAAAQRAMGAREARRAGPRRAPFIVLICGLLTGGLCVLVVLNTASAAAELRRHDVTAANAGLAEDVEQLRSKLAANESAGRPRRRRRQARHGAQRHSGFPHYSAGRQGERAWQSEPGGTGRGARARHGGAHGNSAAVAGWGPWVRAPDACSDRTVSGAGSNAQTQPHARDPSAATRRAAVSERPPPASGSRRASPGSGATPPHLPPPPAGARRHPTGAPRATTAGPHSMPHQPRSNPGGPTYASRPTRPGPPSQPIRPPKAARLAAASRPAQRLRQPVGQSASRPTTPPWLIASGGGPGADPCCSWAGWIAGCRSPLSSSP